MALLRDSPYIRVTWLTKLLAGEKLLRVGCLVPIPTRSMEPGEGLRRFDLVGWQLV